MRSRLVSFLARLDDDESLGVLRQAAEDEALPVRMRALLALADRGEESAYEPLLPLLNDPSEAIRTQLAHAFGGIGTAPALERLVEMATNDESPQVRLAAVRAMGEAKAPSAQLALLDVLTKGPGYLHYDAAVALRRLTGKDIGVDPEGWREALAGSAG
jgi:HEAT repeat protein